MNEPLDSRPQRTLNRLRLAVAVPVALAGVGILFLVVQLARHFREREELPAQEFPSGPPTARGKSDLGNTPAVALPKARTQPPVPPAVKPAARAGVSTPATSVEGVTPAVAVNTQPMLATPAIVPTAVGALAARGIMGRVVLRGTPPPEKEIPMDPSCGKIHVGKATTRFFVLDAEGGLADVFLWLYDFPGVGGQPPTMQLEIRQHGCEYSPYVSAVQIGQHLRIFNDDALLHNVHATPDAPGNSGVNQSQLPGAAPLDLIFAKPELFLRFKCDVHPWMFAYVNVSGHPFYAVSGTNGTFAIPEPPPGEYQLQILHRKLESRLVKVSVQQGQGVRVNVVFDYDDAGQTTVKVLGD